MLRAVVSVLVCFSFSRPLLAAVLVVGNFTPADVSFTVAEPGQKPRPIKLTSLQIVPITVAGPVDLTFTDRGGKTTRRLDPYNAFLFVPDPNAGVRLEGLELPGKPPAQDAKPDPTPAAREPVKIPVTLMVDDQDPRADRLWRATVRQQFDQAAAIVESHCGVRFEFAGYGTWTAAPADTLGELLEDFEKKVAVKPGRLAIGWVSRRPPEKDDSPAFGACRGVPATHIVLRHGRLTDPSEQVEVLAQQLGTALGAVPVPDPGSVMRPRLGDGLARRRGFVIRFDPLNALAMSIWAEELRRRSGAEPKDASEANKIRLGRIYRAVLKASPDDPLASRYLSEFEGKLARVPDPRPAPAGKDPARPMPATPRDEAARLVALAVVARAKMNTGPNALTGDELTAAYVRVAADAAARLDEADRAPAFLLGLGVALDDVGVLANDPLTASAVAAVETAAERAERLEVIRVPTLRGRRDLCRRFAIGCATGELLTPTRAENVAVARLLSDRDRPAGACFPNLAAELAGAEFARALRQNPQLLTKFQEGFTLGGFLPTLTGLRDGVPADRFGEDFGDQDDDRFQAVLANIRERVKSRPERK